jgi:radical SAM superfamily enzyme YgiQ (UPF0313 family)
MSLQDTVINQALDKVAEEIKRRFTKLPVRKALLINPPSNASGIFDVTAARKRRYSVYPPYGLLIIAARLREAGYDVRVLDLNFELLASAFATHSSDTFDYRKEWQTPLFSALDDYDPDIVGVTCMFTMTHAAFVDVVQSIKRHSLVPVVIGGVHVSNDTERALRSVQVADAAFTHEADVSFVDFLQFLNSPETVGAKRLSQVALLIDDQYCEIEERRAPASNELNVVAAFDLINTREYSQFGSIGMTVALLPKEKPISTVLSNRGCRAQCTFCSVRYFNGPGVRARSVQTVVDEIELLYSKHGIRHISWLDDDLFYDERRTIQLFNEIVRRNINITWDAGNGVIAAATTPDVIAAAAGSGCIGLYFGIESGNPQMLRDIRKPGTVEKFLQAAHLLKKYPHICTRGFLMLGFPHETLRMMMDTIKLAVELDLDWFNITVLQPLPSTTVYRQMQEEGLLETDNVTDEVRFMIGPYGKQTQLEQFQKRAAANFLQEFSSLSLDEVPPRDRFPNIWFYINYKVNFERVLRVEHPIKLQIQLKYLREMADRVTIDHAFAQFYTGVLEEKSGNYSEASKRVTLTEKALGESAYWRDKFSAFDVYTQLDDLKQRIHCNVLSAS